MIEPVGYLIVGLFAIGMGASFLAADPHSPTSRALSLLFILLGVVFVMNIPGFGRFFGESRLFPRLGCGFRRPLVAAVPG